MNQRPYWESKWKEKEKIEKPNSFARRNISLIKEKNFKKILDLGCGDGRDTIFFARNRLNVVAVDFSGHAIKNLEKQISKRNIRNVKCGVMDISKDLKFFKSNSFDVIYSHLSLHYFRDKITTQIFNELFRILKKNGLIFIKVKSTDDLLYGKGKLIEKDMFFYTHARYFFSKKYMKEKLKHFKILKIRKNSAVYKKYKASFIEAIAGK